MKTIEVKSTVVWDWMRPETATIQVDATVEQAVTRMRKLSIHHLIVVDGIKFMGILDARDCAGVWDKNKKVGEITRTDVPIIEENTEVGKAVETMLALGLTALPLERGKDVHGIITATDLMRLLQARLASSSEFSELLDKGKDFLSRPIVQSLTTLLGNAGL